MHDLELSNNKAITLHPILIYWALLECKTFNVLSTGSAGKLSKKRRIYLGNRNAALGRYDEC